jgi:hypothetical protein
MEPTPHYNAEEEAKFLKDLQEWMMDYMDREILNELRDQRTIPLQDFINLKKRP